MALARGCYISLAGAWGWEGGTPSTSGVGVGSGGWDREKGAKEWQDKWGDGSYMQWCNAKHMLGTCGAETQSMLHTSANTQLCNIICSGTMKDVLVGAPFNTAEQTAADLSTCSSSHMYEQHNMAILIAFI